MLLLRRLKILLLIGGGAFAALLAYGYARNHPEDLPWTALDLAQPVGSFTSRKLAALSGEAQQCHGLLSRAGIEFTVLPPRSGDARCGFDDAVRLRSEGAIDIAWAPTGLGTSCQVAAGLALWEWHVVQPAALRRFGVKVATIEHFGSYSCRRIYGRSQGSWSEHSTANAVDIAAFKLEDGRRVSVVSDWNGEGPKAGFLREVRDGACRIFATTLSPDYNRAHRDHLHLDQANRGAMGWSVCR